MTFFIAILVGGRGSILGPFIGNIILTLLPEFAAPLVAWSTFLYAALLLVIVLLIPGGSDNDQTGTQHNEAWYFKDDLKIGNVRLTAGARRETLKQSIVDPLGGSYFVEKLTRDMEEGTLKYWDNIDRMGGMVEAIERQTELAERRRSFVASALKAEQQVEATRAAASQAQLAAQETRVRRESLSEQFAATRFDLTEVTAGLSAEANVAAWETSVADVEGKIERLGQVNLAAIDEFKEQSERKEYLDKQFADLTEALNALESAIRKIDRETRERFQDTFDRVNAGLQSRFPRLFGGGTAYLELVGEDARTEVVALPPKYDDRQGEPSDVDSAPQVRGHA